MESDWYCLVNICKENTTCVILKNNKICKTVRDCINFRYHSECGLSQWETTSRLLLAEPTLRMIPGFGYEIPVKDLTHWGRETHIYVSNLTIIGSDNGLSPGRRQAIIWTNAGILLIGPLGTNFNETSIEIHTFSFKKIHVKLSRKSTCRTGHALDLRYQCLLHSSVKYNLGQHNMPRVIRRQHIIHKLLRGRGFHCLCMSKVTDKSPNQSINQSTNHLSIMHPSVHQSSHPCIHRSDQSSSRHVAWDPLYWYGITLVPTWISNHMQTKVRD